MDLDASICSNYYDFIQRSWIIYLKISFHISLTNLNLHMQFSTTVWNNFTMQDEVRMRISRPEWANSSNSWILHIPCSSPMFKYSMHSSSLGKNDQCPYHTSLNACLPSSDPHLRLMETTQRIPTHIISHPDFKQRHSSIFTYNEYIVFSCWSWGLGN